MDIRVLRYYLAICQEGTMSRAAEVLHVTQPTLSRQIADLERELDCTLFERGSRSIKLTDKGMYLRRRATEIVALADQTESDFKAGDDIVEGDVSIGAGESDGVRVIASLIRQFREQYPQVHFHLHSGNATDVTERLERGLVDFAVLMNYSSISRYSHIRLRPTDAWGVLMREDAPLAAKETIAPADLAGLPLIVSKQALTRGDLSSWFGSYLNKLDIVATYNLFFNAEMLVREGVGYVLTFDKLSAAGAGTGVAFRLLYPPAISTIDFAWKHDQVFTSAAQRFLDTVLQAHGA